MTTIKIEHVDAKNSRPVAFDVMGMRNTDPKLGPVTPPRTDGRKDVVDGLEVRSTFVLERFGDFHLMDLAGGVMLHEVSQVELDERAEVVRLREEAEAAVAKDAADKADAEKAKRVADEAEARKKQVAAEAAKLAAPKPSASPPTPPVVPAKKPDTHVE